jgi:hypothetical protein
MNIGHTIAYCFMGLVGFMAIAAQTALVSGLVVA